jgi:hypothetical protein
VGWNRFCVCVCVCVFMHFCLCAMRGGRGWESVLKIVIYVCGCMCASLSSVSLQSLCVFCALTWKKAIPIECVNRSVVMIDTLCFVHVTVKSLAYELRPVSWLLPLIRAVMSHTNLCCMLYCLFAKHVRRQIIYQMSYRSCEQSEDCNCTFLWYRVKIWCNALYIAGLLFLPFLFVINVCVSLLFSDQKVWEARNGRRKDTEWESNVRPVHHEGTTVSISREWKKIKWVLL